MYISSEKSTAFFFKEKSSENDTSRFNGNVCTVYQNV
jgi:hypothetical protein